MDPLVNIVLFDKGIRPDRFEDIVLIYKVTTPFYQKSEDLKGLFGKGINGEAVNAFDSALVKIEAKIAEIDISPVFPARSLSYKQKQDSGKRKDFVKILLPGFRQNTLVKPNLEEPSRVGIPVVYHISA